MLISINHRLIHQSREIKESFRNPEGQAAITGILNPEWVESTLATQSIQLKKATKFKPTVVLWIFLTQVFNSDASCKNALLQWIALLTKTKRKACSSATGGYVLARSKLPLEFFKAICFRLASQLEEKYVNQTDWSYQGRSVKMIDGSTSTVPDTSENQRQFPISKTYSGYPILRYVVLISYATGAWLDMRVGPYIGKGTGESSLFLKMLQESPFLKKGDILLFDKLFSSYVIMAICIQKGIDIVTLQFGAMNGNKLKTLRWLGDGDRLVELKRPYSGDTSSDPELLKLLPKTIILREITYFLSVPGFRTKKIVIMTSLLDPLQHPLNEVATLYYLRWNCELDLRNIKAVMHMGELRCKTPKMLEKELWTHAIGYNLIRALIAESARIYQAKPRELSFKGTLQILNSFRPYLFDQGDCECSIESILELISKQTLILRPFRVEPRAIKKSGSPYSRLTQPRTEARRGYWKKGSAFKKRKKDTKAASIRVPLVFCEAVTVL
jgi:Transposase DDE domain